METWINIMNYTTLECANLETLSAPITQKYQFDMESAE